MAVDGVLPDGVAFSCTHHVYSGARVTCIFKPPCKTQRTQREGRERGREGGRERGEKGEREGEEERQEGEGEREEEREEERERAIW